ncbi:hypothetical protein AB4455_22700 [Vibrio sp. 10N.261.46.E12]|uniref:hypothetical protein n=1 Tax=unclassified Vibrio TaxID=2614977 RepID=UPI0009771EDC|nr:MULTISPECIES: hypothetical protein [unclassified Vibrio]OMO35811.1 hypothetical protein BH584_06900 [Vibrio sp. 10N.261.45.E1]PMJ34958.1 hypothetical protein BCU27_24535 [Vibrio sp. 10N.286.45.B6]PML86966.1 hypothetical protein BCT66_12975 [Vibrio sp. 10N.261.49.E11]PMM75127.1 hypothetical protein BCT48_25465 [Vibrio sp. 10N.261.46.F12]PMM85743.1 hypothetical protein BCT46_08755 [Vibrio sp. 10N.261.46.E8]
MTYRKTKIAYSVYRVKGFPILLVLVAIPFLDHRALFLVHVIFTLYILAIFYAPVWDDSSTIEESSVFHFHRFVAELRPDFNFILEHSSKSDLHCFLQVRYAKRIAYVREQHRDFLKTFYGDDVRNGLLIACLTAALFIIFGNGILTNLAEEPLHISPWVYALLALNCFQLSILLSFVNVRLLYLLKSGEEKELFSLIYEYSQLSDKHQEEIESLRKAATSKNRLHWLTN